ncbi:MAG TPA: ribbon-helix-helix protein, CopG family [Candidatus Eisenbacteria bacterium]|jgi:predicted transcriptional regulator
MAKDTVEPKVPAIVMVPVSTREMLDRMARAQQVSRSEIGRQAIERFVKDAKGADQ